MAEKGKRSWGDYFLICLGAGVALAFVVVLLDKGHYGSRSTSAERPRFDKKGCLERNTNRIRGDDPSISDEALFGAVARVCVVERSEFEDWK